VIYKTRERGSPGPLGGGAVGPKTKRNTSGNSNCAQFWGAMAKISENQLMYVMSVRLSVRPSVRPHWRNRLCPDGLTEKLLLGNCCCEFSTIPILVQIGCKENGVRRCLLSFGAESFVFQFDIQKYTD